MSRLLNRVRVKLPPKRAQDPRIGNLFGAGRRGTSRASISLIGFPCEQGVKLNQSRLGAALAPQIIRERFYSFTPDALEAEKFLNCLSHSKDLGDVKLARTVSKSQENLAEVVAGTLKSGSIPVIIGGGHETTFGHFLGYVLQKRKVNLLNLDAHADVRVRVNGEPHSGSPFRDALEHRSALCASYTVLGLQPHAVAAAHLKYLQQKRVRFSWAKDVSIESISSVFRTLRRDTLVSIDMDSINQAFAPGVAAPAINGLPVEFLFHYAFEAGRSPFVTSLDVVEVNPALDSDNRTSGLAALAIWHFVRGLTKRRRK